MEELTEFQKTIIYKFGRKVNWSKTGNLPLPFVTRLFGPSGSLAKTEITKGLKKYLRVRKRQKETVVYFSDDGFTMALKVKDELES